MTIRFLIVTVLSAVLSSGGRSESTNNSDQAGLPIVENGVTKVVANPRSHKEAIELVSTLRAGTKQRDVEQFLATNHVRFYSTFGGSAHWISIGALNDGTSLNILYRRGGSGASEQLHDGFLEGAWIDSTNKLEGASPTVFHGMRFYQKSIPLALMP